MAYDLHGDWDPITGHNTAMASDGQGKLDLINNGSRK